MANNTNKTEKTIRVTKAMRNEDIIAMLELIRKNAPLAVTPANVPHGTTIEKAIEHLKYENELLARKNSGDSKKATKAQEENKILKDSIIAYLTGVTEGVTASDVMVACNLSSNQKAAALLKQLKDEGEVIKKVVRGKALFMLSDGVVAED